MSSPATSPWTDLRGASRTIVANAEYVLQEIGSLDVPDDWRARVRAVWEQVREAGRRIEALAARGLAHTVRYPHDEVEVIENRLAPALRGLDDLVQALGTEAHLALVAILVTESAANVVRACAEVRLHAREVAGAKQAERSLRAEAGLPDGTELVRRLPCASCGRTAVTVEVGIDPLTGDRALVYSGLVRREAFHLGLAAAVFAKLAQGRVGEAHRTIDPEGIDAYCPTCGLVYCRDHYRLEAEYDEGFYDCTHATCPAGHRRLVDD
jgi:hypothetical protein